MMADPRPLASIRLALTAALLASLTFGEPGAYALAKPVRADRSDNTYYFTYDASEGETTSEASSLQEKRNDPVSHRIYIDTMAHAKVGKRIKAKIILRLNAKKKRAFRGDLGVEVRDSAAQIVYRAIRKVNFVLRPKKGMRKKRFVFRFDLPSGDYSATSDFDAPPP